MQRYRLTWLAPLACFAVGCATSPPRSFSRMQSPTWASFEVRKDLDYERAWNTVLEILIKDFDIDMALRDEGYIRTGWLYTWSGAYLSHYRVRVTVKFSPDRKTLQFRPEAHFLQGKEWSIGTDARLVSTIKTDLMGTVGRTTR